MSVALVLTSCASSTPSSGSIDTISPDDLTEVRVIKALRGFPYKFGSVYEVEQRRLLVTVYSEGEHIPDSVLSDIRSAAEAVAGDAPVVVEVDDGPAPRAVEED